LNVPRLIINGVFGEERVVRDHVSLPLFDLLNSHSFLLLLLFLDFKHPGQVKELATAAAIFSLYRLDLSRLLEISRHKVLVLIII
jgi:hypothetical protein